MKMLKYLMKLLILRKMSILSFVKTNKCYTILYFKKLKFSLFSDNSTIPFMEMTKTLGSAIIVIPLIAILESVAIAKAFGKHFISTIYNSFSYSFLLYVCVCLFVCNR